MSKRLSKTKTGLRNEQATGDLDSISSRGVIGNKPQLVRVQERMGREG